MDRQKRQLYENCRYFKRIVLAIPLLSNWWRIYAVISSNNYLCMLLAQQLLPPQRDIFYSLSFCLELSIKSSYSTIEKQMTIGLINF